MRRQKRQRGEGIDLSRFFVVRIAAKHGFTREDLEQAARATGKCPLPEQVKAADDRDVAMALIEARRKRLRSGP